MAEPDFDTPAVTIHCKRPGFRRGGMRHPAEASYKAGHFSAEHLKLFEAEPNLVVTVDDGDGEASQEEKPDDPAVVAERIKEAVSLLGENDFTKDGKPKIAALEEALGFDVSREEVEAAGIPPRE